MNRNDNLTLHRRNSIRKRKIQPVPNRKKLRSKIPRRKRLRISPITSGSLNLLFSDKKTVVSAFPAASSSSSCFPEENSCSSSLISIGSVNVKKKQRSSLRKRGFEEIRCSEDVIQTDERCLDQSEKFQEEKLRRITRSYRKNKDIEKTVEKKGNGDFKLELSESSCVESFSGAAAFTERNPSFKNGSRKGAEKAEENQRNAASSAITVSDISNFQKMSQQQLGKSDEISERSWNKKARTSTEAENSPEGRGHEAISKTSCLESPYEAKNQNQCQLIRDLSQKNTEDKETAVPRAEFSRNYAELSQAVSNSESTAEQKTMCFDFDYDLACSEQFSFEDDSDYSNRHGMSLAELDSVILTQNSDEEFSNSDYTPPFHESASDFSEAAGNSTPSACFSLLLLYKKQFNESNPRSDIRDSSLAADEYLEEFTFLRFEDEDEEESYKNIRSRERRQAFMHNYVDDYGTMEDRILVLEQRFLMVKWIVEQTENRELQDETMFLGVSLLDRFLSRGFFKKMENLRLLGIACLTLAIRIEENQPLNSVRQMTFEVKSNVYRRCEVVAMEWLVQEVLDFQCFFPTTYNFLWFYLKAARADQKVEERAKHLAMLSLLNHQLLGYWPSTVAAGLVILASLTDNQDSSCKWVMETHVRTKNDDLAECIKSLDWLVPYAT